MRSFVYNVYYLHYYSILLRGDRFGFSETGKATTFVKRFVLM